MLSYNTDSNKYTTPFDGYLFIYSGAHAGNIISASISGLNDGANFTFDAITCANAIYLKKGMKLYINNNTGSANIARFLRLT